MTPNQKETAEIAREIFIKISSEQRNAHGCVWECSEQEYLEQLIMEAISEERSKTAVEREEKEKLQKSLELLGSTNKIAYEHRKDLEAKLTSATSEIERLRLAQDAGIMFPDKMKKLYTERAELLLDNGRLREALEEARIEAKKLSFASSNDPRCGLEASANHIMEICQKALAIPSQSLGWLKEVREALVLMEEHSDCASDMARCDFDHRIVWQKYEKALKLLEEGGI